MSASARGHAPSIDAECHPTSAFHRVASGFVPDGILIEIASGVVPDGIRIEIHIGVAECLALAYMVILTGVTLYCLWRRRPLAFAQAHPLAFAPAPLTPVEMRSSASRDMDSGG